MKPVRVETGADPSAALRDDSKDKMKMQHQSSTGPSQRQLRVGEQVRHAIVEVMQRGKFDDIALIDAAHTVTVSEVRLSPDLKNATAFVMTLGGARMDEVLPALNDAASIFQRELGRKVQLKFTPKIKFVTDNSFDEAQKINSILSELNEREESQT
jgi:ribosome-binding factor A